METEKTDKQVNALMDKFDRQTDKFEHFCNSFDLFIFLPQLSFLPAGRKKKLFNQKFFGSRRRRRCRRQRRRTMPL
jgi:hypothetical protein